MRGMGFSERWIFRVMTCVRTVTYSVSVNGNHSGRIIPTRGIRQGDPLSPYLFLLCMEGFTSLLQRAENNGLIQGVAVARHAPRISHLFFADDSLLFIRAQSSDCTTIIDVLHKFELASGQQINIEKSSVFFSSNTPENTRSSIMELLGVRKILDRDKYLGLPIMLGRSKKRELQYIKNRLLAKIRGWNCRFLSIAGKSILIQSIAQSIPQYLMSVFKFPQTFLHELNMAVANYWWGKGSERRSIHWKNWSSLCISKLDGGLGFRDFEAFNLALLAKQCWRLMHNQQSLCFRLLKAKYINNSNFLQANLRTNPSFVWRSLLAGRKILVEGSRWRIGSGFSVPVRNAKWINKPPTYCPQLLEGVQPNHMIVAELIHQTDRRWLVDKLQELFIEEDVHRIASIPLPLEFESDSLTWNHSTVGEYTVKSGYFVGRKLLGHDEHPQHLRSPIWRMVWQSRVYPKIKYFMWRLIWNILPGKLNLRHRGVEVEEDCNVCAGIESSLIHVFFDCHFAREAWRLSCPWIIQFLEASHDQHDFWQNLFMKANDEDFLDLLFITLWLIWYNRNKCVFESRCFLPSVLVHRATETLPNPTSPTTPHHNAPPSTWNPPSPNNLCLNIDASYIQGSGQSNLGPVRRDSSGRIFCSAIKHVLYTNSALHAEVLGIQFGLQVALRSNVDRIEIQTDCLLAVHEINKGNNSRWDAGCLITEINHLASLFSYCSFSHINRNCNVLAHILAQQNFGVNANYVWYGILPPCVCNPDD